MCLASVGVGWGLSGLGATVRRVLLGLLVPQGPIGCDWACWSGWAEGGHWSYWSDRSGGSAANGSGLAYQGDYASRMNYGVNDVVMFQGSSYVSLVARNLGNTPWLSPPQWGVLAQAAVGATGATGATGCRRGGGADWA